MSWLATMLAAVLAALAGGAGMYGIALRCVAWYRISSFEGKSGYFVVGLALAGVLGGGVIGIIAARAGHALVGPAWSSQVGVAIGAVCCVLLAVLTYAFLGADHERDLGDRGLVVEWEIRFPAGGGDDFGPRGDPRTWPDSERRLQLVSVHRRSPGGYENAVFDGASFHKETGAVCEGEGVWILPARVPLFTSKGEFCVNLTLGGRDDGFWPPLSPRTPPTGGEWSAWFRTNKSLQKLTDEESTMYRFRVVRAEHMRAEKRKD
jgi:hypothetical protein